MEKHSVVSSEEGKSNEFLAAARTSYEMARRGPVEGVDLEFVTDDILQVVIYIDARDCRVENFQWLFVDAVERAAVLIEDVKGVSARSLVLGLGNVWQMISVRLLSKRSRDRLKKD